MTDLKGKTAIITGAGRGIGRAIAAALAAEGVRLGLLLRGAVSPFAPGTEICQASCDLACLDSIPAAVRELVAKLGPVDYLINNAGIFVEQSVAETSPQDLERVLRVNLMAPMILCREVLPGMMERRSGRIINIASTSAVQGYPGQSAYCASKHGLLGFARSLAIEVKPYNIHVHTLCPGGVDTDLIKGTAMGERVKNQPLIAPADIAETVVFLLSRPDNIDLPEITIRRFVSLE